MTGGLSPFEREQRRRRRQRGEIVRWTVRLIVILLVLGIGIALGEALHDNPRPGDTVTFERTMRVPSVPPGSTATP